MNFHQVRQIKTVDRLFERNFFIGTMRRIQNCLKADRILSLGDLVRSTENDLMAIPNFCRVSLEVVKCVLAVRGLHLGMAEFATVLLRQADKRRKRIAQDLRDAKRAWQREQPHLRQRRRDEAIRTICNHPGVRSAVRNSHDVRRAIKLAFPQFADKFVGSNVFVKQLVHRINTTVEHTDVEFVGGRWVEKSSQELEL